MTDSSDEKKKQESWKIEVREMPGDKVYATATYEPATGATKLTVLDVMNPYDPVLSKGLVFLGIAMFGAEQRSEFVVEMNDVFHPRSSWRIVVTESD